MFDLRDFIVREIVYIDEDCRLGQAAEMLCDSGQVVLPVVNQCLELVGILTEKAVLAYLCSGRDRNIKAAKCMQTKFTSVDENTGFIDVVCVFARENYRQIPVVSEQVLVGLFNRTDIIRYLMDAKSAASRRSNKKVKCSV